MSKKHFAGGKITRSHTTVIEAAHEVVRAANASANVSKIAIGKIQGAGSTKRRIKF